MNDVKLTDLMRKTELTANEINLFKQSFVIVPYWPSGFIDYTNRGYSDEPINPEDFETFKRLWTGNDAFIVTWKNSVTYGENEKNEKSISYHLGEVLLGLLEQNDSEVQINQDESFSAYKSQQSKDKITMRVSSYFKISDNYKLLFYKFPELSGSTLYRISSLEKDWIGRKLVGYIITFESLNQDLANTGRARQQNVMPCAVGQGYLECVVKESNWPEEIGQENFDKLVETKDYFKFYDRYITADFQKTLNRPAYNVVVKQFGVSVPSSVVFLGRPAGTGTIMQNFKTPRLIFPVNFNNASTPNLYNTQQNETNYYFGSFSPTIEYWKDWKENIKDVLTSAQNQWSYNGFIKYDFNELRKSNPIDDKSYKFDIFGYIQKTTDSVYQVPWNVNITTNIIKTSMIDGCSSEYNIGGPKNIHDHMFDNFWTQKNMKTLPINKENTFSFGFSLSSLIVNKWGAWYSAISLAIIGVSYLSSKFLNKMEFQTFRGLISAPFLDLNNDQWKNTAGGTGDRIEMGVFNGNKDTPTAMFFNSNTLNASFQAKLTDTFTDSRYPATTLFNTNNIGQEQFENEIYINDNKTPYLLNGKTSLVAINYGFIIDRIIICSMGKVDLSFEFLDENENVIWTGIYQSEGKWTDSVREIWTEKNTSVFNRENLFFNNPIPYPKPLPPLIGELPELPNFVKEIKYRHKYHYNDSSTDTSFIYLENIGFFVNSDYIGLSLYKTGDYPSETHKYELINKTEFVDSIEKFIFYYPNTEISINCFSTFNNAWFTESTIFQTRLEDYFNEFNHYSNIKNSLTPSIHTFQRNESIRVGRYISNSNGCMINFVETYITLENDKFYLNVTLKPYKNEGFTKRNPETPLILYTWTNWPNSTVTTFYNTRLAPGGVISAGNTINIKLLPRLP